MVRPLTIAADVARRYEEHERALDLAQVARARILTIDAMQRGRQLDIGAAIKELGAPDRVVELVRKAAIPGATAAGNANSGMVGTWRTTAQAFLRSLQSVGVFDALIGNGAVVCPWFNFASLLTAISAGTADTGQSQGRAVRRIAATPQTMAEHMAAAIVVMSADHLREIGPAGLQAVDAELRRGVVRSTDTVALAQLLTGVTPIASAGDPGDDIATLLLALDRDAQSRLVFAVGLDAWAELDSLAEVETPAALRRWPVIPSDAVDANSIVGIVADSILVSDQGIDLDTAEHASLQMLDDDTGDGSPADPVVSQASDSPPVPTSLVSLWQTNSVGLRVQRRFKLDVARSGAVAQVDGITWNSGSP
jgi:hypothetical protein